MKLVLERVIIHFVDKVVNMKKVLPMIFATTALLLGGCAQKIKVNPDKEKYVVGVAQLVDHVALNAATKGFKDKLSELLTAEGRQVEYIDTNALGDLNLCPQIASTLVAKDVDLILANATPCVSAVYNVTTAIPILGTSVTDYGVAISNEMKDGKSGTNVSGTSDLAPIDVQVDEMVKLLNLKSGDMVGILYCSGEANSKFQVVEAKKYLEGKGIKVKEYAFSQASEIQAVCNTAVGANAIYIPTDNTCAKNAGIIDSVFAGRVPVYAGEEGICKECGIATLTIDYEKLGQITGEMAFNVLLGKEDIREMAIRYDSTPVKKYVASRCEAFNVTALDGYEVLPLE